MANQTVKQLFDSAAAASLTDTMIFYAVETPYGSGDDRPMSGAVLKESIQDLMNSTLVGGSNISISYNDPAGTLTISYTGAAPPADTDDLPEGATNLYFTNERAQDAVGAMIDSTLVYVDGTPLLTRAALTGDVTAPQGSNATTIANNAVTDGKLRDSAALSVIGRSANSTGDPADIAAANDGEVLRRSGTALGFGTVATAGLANGAVTYAKIQNVSATDMLLGRSTAGAGVVEEIPCTAAGRALLDDAAASNQRATLGISTPATLLLNCGMAFTTGNVNDDAAASVALGNFNGGTIIIQANVTAGGMGLFFVRTNTTVASEIVAQIGTTVNVVAGDGSLSGTTGTDGKTNIRCDSAAGLLWIENRTGAVRGYTVYFFRQ